MSKRTLLLTLAAGVAVLFAAAGAGTMALFSAQAATATNQFVAGTLSLNLTRDQGDIPETGPIFYSTLGQGQGGTHPTGLWAPGDTHRGIAHVTNTGTLPLKLTQLRADLGAPDASGMANRMTVRVYDAWSGDELTPPNTTLADLMAPGGVSVAWSWGGPIELFPGDLMELNIDVTFDQGADNSFQGQTLVLDLHLDATQVNAP